jgi:hypothetical protein
VVALPLADRVRCSAAAARASSLSPCRGGGWCSLQRRVTGYDAVTDALKAIPRGGADAYRAVADATFAASGAPGGGEDADGDEGETGGEGVDG